MGLLAPKVYRIEVMPSKLSFSVHKTLRIGENFMQEVRKHFEKESKLVINDKFWEKVRKENSAGNLWKIDQMF